MNVPNGVSAIFADRVDAAEARHSFALFCNDTIVVPRVRPICIFGCDRSDPGAANRRNRREAKISHAPLLSAGSARGTKSI